MKVEIFNYIEDDVIRENCISDFNELEICLANKLYKASVVLAGSLIEAVLYYFISSNDEYKSKIKKFDERNVDERNINLNNLLTWSKKFEIIDDSLFKLADQVRDYRNTIHPNVYIRKGLKINKNVAMISYNVLLEIIRIIFKRFKKSEDNEYSNYVWDIVESKYGRPAAHAELYIYESIIEKYGKDKGGKIIIRSIGGDSKNG